MSSISYWTKSESTTIYPSLEFDKYYDYESLVNFVKTLKESLNNKLEIVIYKKNEYCFEVNGSWNVSFGVVKDGITYMYMLRNDKHYNKIYGCPFQNVEYVSLKHTILNNTHNNEAFNLVESTLKDIVGSKSKKIDSFPTY